MKDARQSSVADDECAPRRETVNEIVWVGEEPCHEGDQGRPELVGNLDVVIALRAAPSKEGCHCHKLKCPLCRERHPAVKDD